MAKDSDHLAGSFDTENTGGFLTGFLAEEDNFDRRTLWRLRSWAAGVGGGGGIGRRRDRGGDEQPFIDRIAPRPGGWDRSGAPVAADPVRRQGKPERGA